MNPLCCFDIIVLLLELGIASSSPDSHRDRRRNDDVMWVKGEKRENGAEGAILPLFSLIIYAIVIARSRATKQSHKREALFVIANEERMTPQANDY